jgi:predicted DNA-binding transcriptional regulator AlpA
MARQIVKLKDLPQFLPLTVNQVYKLIRRQDNPLPFKKCGKLILFDLERVYKWFDSLPGRDETI